MSLRGSGALVTELAYLSTAGAGYEASFAARVVALPPGAIVLDRTLFCPAGGGQPCDRGALTGPDGRPLPIVDVTRSGSVVIHRLGRGSRPALRVGDFVQGQLDWDRRYGHMRLHTAQHLLSAVVFQRTGLKTRKATFAAGRGTIDVVGPWPVAETPASLAESFGTYLAPPREVRIRWLPRTEWEANPSARAGLVPLPAQVDPVRVIEIDGIDTCPCGGTHLRSTGEVGGFEIDPFVQAADATRIGFALRTAAAHSERVTP
jgi:misacylated tRNA(Ala) deacylase